MRVPTLSVYQFVMLMHLQIALLVASEFFEQGDIEKKELKIKPMDMMDRDKEDQLPAMQVGFIDSICMPVYQVISPVIFRCKSEIRTTLIHTLLKMISNIGFIEYQ